MRLYFLVASGNQDRSLGPVVQLRRPQEHEIVNGILLAPPGVTYTFPR